MKFKFKRIAAIILAGMMTVSIEGTVLAESAMNKISMSENNVVMLGVDSDINDVLPDEHMICQAEALEAYNFLYDHFEQDKDNNYIYPSNYAGEYIDNEFNLVLLISDHNDQWYRDMLKDYNCVKFKKVDYSYSELNELRQNCVDDLLDLDDSALLYCGSYIDVESNMAVVEIDRNAVLNYKNKKKIQLNDNKAIRYETVDGGVEAQSLTVIGGDYMQIPTGSCTVGMAGFYNGKPAIVSCGHGMENFAKVSVNEDSHLTEVGTVSFVRFDNNEYGDYSFTVLNDAVQTTNEVRTNTSTKEITDGYNRPLPIGAEGYRYGDTSKLSKFKVLTNQAEKNVSIKKSDNSTVTRTIKGLTVTETLQGDIQPGDSGGPNYIWEGNQWKFCGVTCGVVTNNNTRSVFTPYMYFNGGFQCKTS